jgi:hypothetical protein
MASRKGRGTIILPDGEVQALRAGTGTLLRPAAPGRSCPWQAGRTYAVREAWSPDHKDCYPFLAVVFRADGYPTAQEVRWCRSEREAEEFKQRHWQWELTTGRDVARRLGEPWQEPAPPKQYHFASECLCHFRWRSGATMPAWATRHRITVTAVQMDDDGRHWRLAWEVAVPERATEGRAA